MTNYLSEANALAGELAALRHAFHRQPELGNREHQTAARIEGELAALGIPSRRLLDTAVVARLEGGRPGRTVALRADMDALPIAEATGCGFASENPGVMHACGHDVHLAAALGAAKLLAARREALPGAVVFLFQPDEEGRGGARRMIEAGALSGVDAVFGAHVSPELPLGTVGVRYGKFYAASDTFRIVVKGKGAHAAEREKGVDALGAAADLATGLIALPRAVLPGERAVVTVGTLRAGTAENALADRAELAGIVRTLGPQARSKLKGAFRETVDATLTRWGATAEVELRESYPGVVNDDAMTALAEKALAGLLGPENVRVLEAPTLTTEDFGYFLMERPGSFYHVGAGCPLPLHNAAFLPDDRAAVVAAAAHAAVIEGFLGE